MNRSHSLLTTHYSLGVPRPRYARTSTQASTTRQTHQHGGKARWADRTDWRATYGQTARTARVQLVAAARARLAGQDAVAGATVSGSGSSPSAEVAKQEPSRRGGRPGLAQKVREDGPRYSARPLGRRKNKQPRTPRFTSGRGSAFTAEQDEFLISSWSKLTARQQAERLAMPYARIVSRRARLVQQGRASFTGNAYQRRWSPEENDRLKEMLGKVPIAEISRRLGRSLNSLHVHMVRNHMSQRAGAGLSARAVAQILGTADFHPERTWSRWGYLKGQRTHLIAGRNRKRGLNHMWAFQEEELVRFLREHPEQYDRTKIRHPYYRRIADEVWNADPLLRPRDIAKALGLGDAKGAHHLVMHYRIPALRRGMPGLAGKSLSGQSIFVRRSVFEAWLRESGWQNYRKVARDPDWFACTRVPTLLRQEKDFPPRLRSTTIVERARRLYASGAIPTKQIVLGARGTWTVARREEILRLKDLFYARDLVLRLTPVRRALIERHEPSWLARPVDLARALADGRMLSLFEIWRHQERLAAEELRYRLTKRWAFVTRHVRQVLEHLGPRTRLGNRRTAIYHGPAHSRRFVRIPLVLARRRGLRECGFCAHQRDHSAARRSRRLQKAA